MRKALIVWGGWLGHQPQEVAEVFRGLLAGEGFAVEVSDTLDVFRDAEKLKASRAHRSDLDDGQDSAEQSRPVYEAVREHGVGIAGCHGGMCDSFREATEWQFMTGGQWVAHPGEDGVRYRVQIVDREHEITRGLHDFEIVSEQYYLHVDPGVKVLATTRFPSQGADGPHVGNGVVNMPQIWTKMYGRGRVFYSALGHQAKVFDIPEARETMKRGFLWAAKREGHS